MKKEKEELIITGLMLLIKSNDDINSSERKVWMYDYNKLFGELEENE